MSDAIALVEQYLSHCEYQLKKVAKEIDEWCVKDRYVEFLVLTALDFSEENTLGENLRELMNDLCLGISRNRADVLGNLYLFLVDIDAKNVSAYKSVSPVAKYNLCDTKHHLASRPITFENIIWYASDNIRY